MPGAEPMDASAAAGAGAVALVPGQGAKAVGKVAAARRAPPDLVDSHTRALGVIQPPPDIRAIVDKTAQFVARNGMRESDEERGRRFFSFRPRSPVRKRARKPREHSALSASSYPAHAGWA